mgnify:CR=1 FL=1
MKEFDYEKAKAGAPVCTRDGRPARIVCWDALGGDLPILALVAEMSTLGNEEELAYWYTKDGKSYEGHEDDLMMASVKHEGWINIYKNDKCGTPETTEIIWKSEESARNAAKGSEDYIATVHIEWEE